VSHVRLRKFNTRENYPDQKLDNDVCMVVRANNTVYLRGQTGMDFDGKVVGVGDAAAQTENAMKCATILLEEARGWKTWSRSSSTSPIAPIASRSTRWWDDGSRVCIRSRPVSSSKASHDPSS